MKKILFAIVILAFTFCMATAGMAQTSCSEVSSCDQRDGATITAYAGLAVDSFAAANLKRYLNPQESGEQHLRGVGGFDFAYRIGKPNSNAKSHRANSLWLYGETIHGVRSSDVDCKENESLPVCKNALTSAQLNGTLTGLGDQTLYMLRNATDLEAFMGLRYEFLTLNPTGIRANVYVKAQAGFLTIAKNGNDAVDLHHVAAGLMFTNGNFTGSYVEVGHGRSDFFDENRHRRIKFDGYATWPMPEMTIAGVNIWAGIQPFAQINIDVDGRSGADSIQNYYGFQFDVRKLFRTKTDTPKTDTNAHH